MLFLGTQGVNFLPLTDRHEIFPQISRGGRAHNLRFEILIFHPKIFGGGKTKFRQILANGRQSEIHNFETVRHIDKRIADLSSAINGLIDSTKFGGTLNQF